MKTISSRSKLKTIKNLITFNWKVLLGFQLIYKAASVLIFVPLLFNVFDTIMNVSGYSYLTLENIGSFLTRPLTLLALILLLFLATFYAMIDIGAVVFTLDQSFQNRKVHFWQVIRFSVKNALRTWNVKNIFLVFVVLLMMPFLNIGLASSLITTISIPEFIMDYITATPFLSVLFALLILFLYLLMRKWLYAFHYFTLEGCSFHEARKKSRALSRSRRFRDVVFMAFMQFVFALAGILFVLLIIALAVIASKIFSGIFVTRWLASTAIYLMLLLSLTILASLSMPVSYGCVSVLYYIGKEAAGEPVLHAEAPEYVQNEKRARLIHRCNLILGALIVTVSLIVGYLVNSGALNPQIEYVRTVNVTAHRGASAFYPENTMAAFEGAKDLGADWIELDVQQTKDGQIIVLHDTNLKRTTGMDANTWEMTYAKIAALDAGSFFSPDFAGEKIPLLSEVAAFARENNIKLNIELKPTGYETDFEKNVIDIIKQNGIEDICVITSQVYDVLQNVKAYDETITTVYVMSIAYGDINQLTAADHFSVEASNATKSLVSRVHNAGKELYVWTVNTKETITKMVELNVDNIITDDIELARQCIYESRYSNLLIDYLTLFQ
ncbi:MAG: glycerophosphoryl diester phosphodiesterase membrane domain-containing protein [bacterium]|nr:glycerophosphoryl diester phosphodiesterase membrane domain-containing protein [bacterium]